MKQIYNWEKSTVADMESDGLLDKASLIHVLSCQMTDGKSVSIEGSSKERLVAFFNYHIQNEIPVIFHNGICYDVPLAEKILGIDLSNLMVIDTLALSWYLNHGRKSHGLDSFFEDYGIAKPKVDDWETLSYEEYKHRCEEDVKINVALWEDLKARLVEMYTLAKVEIDMGNVVGPKVSGDEQSHLDQYVEKSTVSEYINRILTFLMYKMDTARIREKTRFKVDEQYLKDTEAMLEELVEEAKAELEVVMPKVPKYSKRKKPAKPYKKDSTLSASGKAWKDIIESIGKEDADGNPLVITEEGEFDEVKVLSKYEEPNINSSDQIKKWLFSKGWEPETFKFVKDKAAQQVWADSGFRKDLKPEVRKIPQITVDGDDGKELCQSVIKLSDKIPEIMVYAKYTTVKHRFDTIKGFLRDMSEDKFLKARVGGFTNTLRDQHRELVNLPGVDKPYGENIRGSLIAEDGCILMGSDLSSLEDRVKHHFMIPYDPKYVSTMMADDFDPHILMALSSGMISQKEFDDFKKGVKSEHVVKARKAGKATNYASVYNAGPETIARSAGVPLSEGRKLHEGYWKLNWAVKKIAEDQCVIEDTRGGKWLINPINGFCYSLRKESDRFSTLCQGTGSFLFDMWVDGILQRMYDRFGVKRISLSAHDEIVIQIKDLEKAKEVLKEMVESSLEDVNKTYKLRRQLGCDVQWGKRYADIH